MSIVCSVINATPALDLIINTGNYNGNNFYSINVNNVEWLQSGQLEAFFNNKWYTSNATKAQTNSDFQLMKIISTSTTYDRSDDFGGFYTEQIYQWQAGIVIFETNFKIYNDGKAICFVQSFPNGAKGTNYMTAGPNSAYSWGLDVVPFLSFPSFNVINMSSQYASSKLGYLTWTETFSGATYGKAPVPTGALAGLQGGPIVLYDDTGNNAVVISTNDHFGVSTQTNKMKGTTNKDWKLGIASQVLDIPAGFKHETVIVIGEGISDAMLNEWSSRLKSLYHTERVENENDIVTTYLGYWTDAGAYYYGDSWGAASSTMNLSCCSLEVFKDVKQKLDSQQIPIQYWQMDDWWYYGLHPDEYIAGPYWGGNGVKSVQHWNAPNEYYPGGIAALSHDIQLPLLLYAPYFSPDNDWIGEFSFIPQEAGFVLPSPDDSYSFYATLFDFGINASTTGPNTGMVGYEIDFMSSLSGIPQFRTHINQQQIWLDGMNKAAEERGIPIQYCMATPMDLMQSLSLGQVTNGRASGDYAGSDNYNIGPGALLWSALDLKPSKDNFWTSLNEGPPHYHPSGSDDHNSTEVHAMIAVFSCGPVGISDRSGWSNATLIMRLCNAEGRLLQPSRPITAMDDQFIYDVFNSKSINIWSTEFGPYDGMGNVQIYGYIVLAIDMKQNYMLRYDSFKPSLGSGFMTLIRNWHNYTYCNNGTLAIASHCVEIVNANSNSLYTLSPQQVIYPMHESFELIHIIPYVSTSSLVFLGELDKYVSVSQHRFTDLIVVGNSLSVKVKGKPKEIVSITILAPNNDKTDWIVNKYQVMIGTKGTTTFVM
eukprot:48160_1